MLRRSAARRARHDRGAGIPCDTRWIGVPDVRTAGAALRSASSRIRDRWSGAPPRPRRETSTPPPTSSARECPPNAAAAARRGSRSTLCHVRAVGGGAKEDGTADRGGKSPSVRTLDQSENAPAEPGPHDASAVTPRDAPGFRDQCVHGWGRDFEIIAQALVRLFQQSPKLIEVAPLQRIDEQVNTRDLGIHVPPPLRITGLRFTPPLVVWSG